MIDDTLLEAEEKMDKAVSVAKDSFAAIRTGRAHPGMFARVVVEYYGTVTPLNQLAGFTVSDARMIVINPYDKASLRAIEKAIRDSDLGVNPTDDGNVIRVSVPQLTEERRRDYIKLARGEAEEAKIAIRNVRRHAKEALDKLEKAGDAGEDDVHRAEKELDDLTHRYVGQIDDVLRHKEVELLEV